MVACRSQWRLAYIDKCVRFPLWYCMLRIISLLFPVWAIALSGYAYYYPNYFLAMKPAIPYLLGVIMFGMGMTLNKADFARVIKRPGVIAIGMLLQFGVMPMAAFLIASVFDLPKALLIGMLLVGAAPGGTASNVVCYLAKADVALSISLTLASTLLSIVMMPVLSWLYLHQTVQVNVADMMLKIVWIVFIPVLLGVILNQFFARTIARAQALFPLLSMAAIVLIIAVIVAANQHNIDSLGLLIAVAVMLHNLIGLVFGYSVSKLLGFDIKTCRTLAIEVGMQNSGLAITIAQLQYKTMALATLPGAIFSIWHNISGAVLASVWNLRWRQSR